MFFNSILIVIFISTVNTWLFDSIERKHAIKVFYGGLTGEICTNHGIDRILGIARYSNSFKDFWQIMFNLEFFYHTVYDFEDLSPDYKEGWINLPKVLQKDNKFHPSGRLRECLFYNYDKCYCKLQSICFSFYLESHNLKYPKLTDDLLSIYWHYYNCFHRKDTYHSCPNPCNNHPCDQATSRGCEAYYDPSLKYDLAYTGEVLRHMIQLNYRCKCKKFFFWNKTSRICEPVNRNCKIHCYNDGTCALDRCICHPAFTGEFCDKILNPCYTDSNKELVLENCEDFRNCKRNPASSVGYHCNCGARPGYKFLDKSDGAFDPRCVDIDECKTHLKDRCLNGGICLNLNGSFMCQCPYSLTGPFCEIQLEPVFVKWLAWGPISGCSVPCSTGHSVRYRVCRVPDSCPGKSYKFELCDNSRKTGCDPDVLRPPKYKENKTEDMRQMLDIESFKIFYRINIQNNAKRLYFSLKFLDLIIIFKIIKYI